MRPVAVTVTYKSAPVEGATVVLYSQQHYAKGITNAQGIADLYTTVAGDGVYIGEYQAMVEKQEVINPEGATSRDQVKIIRHIPAKYGDFNTSKLTVTVSGESANQVTFDLKD